MCSFLLPSILLLVLALGRGLFQRPVTFGDRDLWTNLLIKLVGDRVLMFLLFTCGLLSRRRPDSTRAGSTRLGGPPLLSSIPAASSPFFFLTYPCSPRSFPRDECHDAASCGPDSYLKNTRFPVFHRVSPLANSNLSLRLSRLQSNAWLFKRKPSLGISFSPNCCRFAPASVSEILSWLILPSGRSPVS